jgi:FkbH-like protein
VAAGGRALELRDIWAEIERNGVLYGAESSRSSVRRLAPASAATDLPLFVYRNWPVEYATDLLSRFLQTAGLSPRITLSDYDDTLSAPLTPQTGLAIVWMDFGRYEGRSSEDFLGWFTQRIQGIASSQRCPLLVVGSDLDDGGRDALNDSVARRLRDLPDVTFVNPGPSNPASGNEQFVTQSRLSGARWFELARSMGCQWIPQVLHQQIRMIVLDLDNTLYGGVLGEDGIEGLAITGVHHKLHQLLADLAQKGVILSVASKNNPDDVDALLDSGRLSPLTRDSFLDIRASWLPKSSSVAELVTASRLGETSVLFLDDNPGELSEVGARLPGIQLAHASSPEQAVSLLTWFPGLWRRATSAEDASRLDDLKANTVRAALPSQDSIAYLTSLEVEIELHRNPIDHIQRVAELSNKTNQFNLGLRRLTEAEVAARLDSPASFVKAVSLRDRFSHSGLIAVVSGELVGPELIVDELCISCRALGRGLESLIIELALADAQESLGAQRVSLRYHEGPRNEPALRWLTASATPTEQGWLWERSRTDMSIRQAVTITKA